MGTNYYVRTEPSCGGKCEQHCRGGEIHLGKSSMGWAFTFRAYPEPEPAPPAVTWPVNDYASWTRLLSLGAVFDEYGRPVAAGDLLEKIEGKRGGMNTLYGGDFLDADGNRFCSAEFS